MAPAQRPFLFAALAVLACADPTSTIAQQARRPTRILLVYQQQADTRPMTEFSDRFRATIQGEFASRVEFFQEALDLDRIGGARRVSPLSRYFDEKYRGFGVDVVVAVGGRALQFTVDQLSGVLPGVPVVFALNAAPQTNPSTLPPNVTGRLGAASRFAPTLAMARALQPDAERVVVIGGASAGDSVSVAAVVNGIGSARDTLHVELLQGLSLDTLLGKLHQIPRRSIVIVANFRRDGLGQVFDPVDIIGSMARASAAPIYTQLRSYVGEGVVGGSVTSFDDEGARTARLVARALRRRPGGAMPPVERIDNSFVADWRQLRRWGFSEGRLPPGTEVLFREPTLWRRYRTVILFTLVVVAAESLLLGLLAVERRRRRHGEELNRTVLASLSTQIAILDRRGMIIRVNDAWRTSAHHAEANAFVGWNYIEVCRRAEEHGNEEAREVRLGIEAVLERYATPFRCEYRWSTPDERWYELFVDQLQVPEGGAIVTHLDITARRLAERRAEETRRQVAHLGRAALVGELVAAISHELRQPIAAIGANAEAGAQLVANASNDPWEVREIFKDIVAEGAHAAEVIEGIRRLLRNDQRVISSVDLNQICREAVRLLQHEATLRNTRLELSLDSTPPMVDGDPVELRQVVLNLALNGLEAASTSATERSVVVGTESRADYVDLTVHDSGPGIAPQVQPHLFESFFSTKTGGTGLGLVIVRSIVERHGGSVASENDSRGGALFRVRLSKGPGSRLDEIP